MAGSRFDRALAYLGRRMAERGLGPTPLDVALAAAIYSDSTEEYDQLQAWLLAQLADR